MSSILPEVQAKSAPERFEVAFMLLHLSAVLTSAEGRWFADIIRRNMYLRPEVQEEGFGR